MSPLSIFLLSAAVLLFTGSPSCSLPLSSSTSSRSSSSSSPSSCSCTMPSSVQTSFETDTTPIFKAEAVEERAIGDAHYVYTVMRVKVVFRGCAPPSEYIVVRTPATTAACGLSFVPGKVYAVSAKLTRSSTPPPGLPATMDVYTATSCAYNKEWANCPYDDKVFLYYTPNEGCVKV